MKTDFVDLIKCFDTMETIDTMDDHYGLCGGRGQHLWKES